MVQALFGGEFSEMGFEGPEIDFGALEMEEAEASCSGAFAVGV